LRKIYTLGHSTFLPHQFLDGLAACEGRVLVMDVRSHPTSHLTHYQRHHFAQFVMQGGHFYQWVPSLGGWNERHMDLVAEYESVGVKVGMYMQGAFPKHYIARERPALINLPSWTNQGLFDYSWYTTTDDFRQGLQWLAQLGGDEDANFDSVVYVCAEAVWWRCHRSMISDCLYYLGIDTYHILPRFRKDGTQTNDVKLHSDSIGNRLERYDKRILESWSEIL